MSKQLNVNLAFTADTSQAKNNIQAMYDSLQKLSSINPTANMSLSKDMQQAVSSAKQLQMHLENAFDTKTGNLNLDKLNASLKQSNTTLGELSSGLLGAGNSGVQAFQNIQRSVASASVQINQANGLLANFWITLKNTARWQLSSSILHGFMGAVRSAYSYAQDLNESLNNIRIVTGYSTSEMSKFAEQANKAAKILSTTTTAYTDAALIFYQQGLKGSDVTERTNVVVKMANVTGESASQVSDYMTAVWNNFYDGSKSLEYYADVMTALGAATASSTDEIAAGLEKFAAVSETVGLSYEYATAALATVTATTRQSADVVGTAFKTLFARIQDLELGKTLEDGVTLGTYSQALEKVGINIMTTSGELKQMDVILEEMAAKWDKLSQAEQTALAQSVAGVRQYTQLIALMDNWEFMEMNLSVTTDAEGNLQEQADIYAESWEAASKRVTASLQGVFNDLIPEDFIINILNATADIINMIDSIINGIGGLQGILLLVANIALTKLGPSLSLSIQSGIDKVSEFASKLPSTIKSLFNFRHAFQAASTGSAQMVSDLSKINNGLNSAKAQSEHFAQNFTKAKESLSMAQSMNATALEKAERSQLNLSKSFESYLLDSGKIYNIQGLIETHAQKLTSAERERLSVMQQQVLAAAEEKAQAMESLDVAEKLLQRTKDRADATLFSASNYKDNIVTGTDLGGVNKVSAVTDIKSSLQTGISVSNEQAQAFLASCTDVVKELGNIDVQVNRINNDLTLTSTSMNGIGEAARVSAEGYGNIVEINAKIADILTSQNETDESRRQKIESLILKSAELNMITQDVKDDYLAALSSTQDLSSENSQLVTTMKSIGEQSEKIATAFGNSKTHLNEIAGQMKSIASTQPVTPAQTFVDQSLYSSSKYSDTYATGGSLSGINQINSEQVAGIQSSLQTSLSASDTQAQAFLASCINVVKELGNVDVQVNQINNDLALTSTSTDGIGEAARVSAEGYGSVVEINERINQILGQQGVTTTEKSKAIEDIITKAEKEKKITADVANNYRNSAKATTSLNKGNNQLTATMKKTEMQSKKIAIAFGNSEDHLKDMRTGALKVIDAEQTLSDKQLQFNAQLDKTINYLTTAASKASTMGGMITAGLQGFSTIAMGINSVSNAFKTLSDDSASFTSKLTAVAMGLTMGFNALKTAVSGVGGIMNILKARTIETTVAKEALAAANTHELTTETGLAAAKSQSVLISQLSNATSQQEVATILAGIGVKNADAMAETFMTTAKEQGTAAAIKETVANISLAASEYAVLWPLLLIIAALAIVAVGVLIFIKATEKQKTAMEKATEALEKNREELKLLDESLASAKEKLEEIREILNEYDSLQKAFEGLTRGSEEWNEQLIKNNQLVNEMLEKYPELAQYITWEDGVATLPDWARQYIEGNQVVKTMQATIAQNAGALEVKKSQLEVELLRKRESRSQLFSEYSQKNSAGQVIAERELNDNSGNISVTIGSKRYAYNEYNPDPTSIIMQGQNTLHPDDIAYTAMKATIGGGAKFLNEDEYVDRAMRIYKENVESSTGQSYENWVNAQAHLRNFNAEDFEAKAEEIFTSYYNEYAESWSGYFNATEQLYLEELELRRQFLAIEKQLYQSTATTLLTSQKGYGSLTGIEQEAAAVYLADILKDNSVEKKYGSLTAVELAELSTNLGYANNSVQGFNSGNDGKLDGQLFNTQAGKNLLDTYIKENYGIDYGVNDLKYKEDSEGNDPGDYYTITVDGEEKTISAKDVLYQAASKDLYNRIDYDAIMNAVKDNPAFAAGLSQNYLGLSKGYASAIGLSAEGGIGNADLFTTHINETLLPLYANQAKELGNIGLTYDEKLGAFVSTLEQNGTELNEVQQNYLTEANNMLDAAKNYSASEAVAYQARVDEQKAESVIATGAEKYDLDAAALKTYTASIKAANKENKISAELAAKSAVANARYTKGVTALKEALENNTEALSDWINGGEMTYETAEAVQEVITALTDVLGVEVSADFVKKYYSDIKKLQQGGDEAVEALNRLELAAAKDFVANLTISDDYKTQLNEMLEYLNSSETDITIGAEMDISKYAQGLETLLNSGQMTRDQVEAMFAGIEWAPEISEDRTISETPSTTITKISTAKGEGMPGEGDWKLDSWQKVETYPEIVTFTVGDKATHTDSHSGSTVRQGPTTSGGGGGGSGSKQKAEKKRKSEVVDRYKEITDSLEKNAKAIENAEKAADGLYGAARIKNMEKVNALLKNEVDLLGKKRKEALGYLAEDKQALNDAASEAGVTLEFDADGDISNYTKVMTGLYNQLDAEIEKANADGNATEEEQEKIDAMQKKIDNLKGAISDYDKTKSTLFELDQEEIEKFNKQLSNTFEQINAKIELDIEFNKSDLQYIEYMLSKIKEDVYNQAEAAALTSGQLSIYGDNLETYKQGFTDLETAYANGEISQASYVKGMKSVSDGLLENLGNIQKLDSAMKEYYGNTISMAQEEISKYTDLMENATTVLDHYQSLMELFGQQTDYEKMGNILVAKATVSKDAYDVSAATYNMFREQADAAKKAFEDAKTAGATGYELDALEQAWFDAETAANEAQDQMLSDAETWAENMRAVLENSLAGFAQQLEDALTGEFGSFDALSTELERASSLQEEYLTTTNKIYETNKMMRTAQKEIDKTTNQMAKRKLKEFINETAAMQEQGKLSQYELEVQQAKYDLLLAEIALKEAQNAKSTVRLQRDSEGNFGYVYTADQSVIDDAQQKFEDSQNALYNKGLEGANDYAQKYIETMSEMNDTLAEANQKYLDGEYASVDEYNDAIDSIREYYYQKMEDYSSLYQVALGADSRVTKDAWSSAFGDMTQNTEQWKNDTDKYIGQSKQAFEQFQQALAPMKSSLSASAKSIKDITSESQKLKNTLTEKDGVIDSLGKELTAVAQVTQAYASQRAELDLLLQSYENYAIAASEKAKQAAYDENVIAPGSEIALKKTAAWSTDAGDADDYSDKTKGPNVDRGYTVLRWDTGKNNVLISDGAGSYGWVPISNLVGFDTGGYTGEWGSYGKMAMVHEKELILNPHDTENFLASMEFLHKILEVIDLQAMSSQLGGILSSPGMMNTNANTIEQNVHIEASFPNATDHSEIEEAFNNLINTASQYANRK